MLSGDKALMRQEKMLPRHSRLMVGGYASFLSVYFAAVNAYVISLYLERKFPIRQWQKKQEVWRNPRKYILPIIVCVVALAPYLLGFF
jgi:ABC-type branched-subunit amino acid transport system permease subunit